MSVVPSRQGWGIGRTLVRNHVRLYRLLNFSSVLLVAAGEAGGYAWARAGFEADEDSWPSLQKEVTDRLGWSETDFLRMSLTRASRCWSLVLELDYGPDLPP